MCVRPIESYLRQNTLEYISKFTWEYTAHCLYFGTPYTAPAMRLALCVRGSYLWLLGPSEGRPLASSTAARAEQGCLLEAVEEAAALHEKEGREKKPAAAKRVVGEREYIEENVSATDYSQNTSRERELEL